MSAIAHILNQDGHRVSGSDQADSPLLDRLRADGCDVWVGHDASRLPMDLDLVTISTAVTAGNPEFDEAVRRGVPIASRPDMMEAIGRRKRTVAVSGTHGKSTTSAMLALTLDAAGWNPSFLVGGTVRQLGTGVRWTDSAWFAVEADESDSSFLRFRAEAVIVTNVEPDHLDHHGTMANLEQAFDTFVRQAAGPRVICVDDPGARALAERVGRNDLCTYGIADDADYRIVDLSTRSFGSSATVVHDGAPIARLELQLPGDHVVRNATAVLAMAAELGIPPETAAAALSTFGGVGRRFERRGEARGVTFVDDYAHLPAEVATNVRAAALTGHQRVVAVFQPHRYTRVRDVGVDFATSFDGADVVVVTGLYSAGQQPIPGISGRTVADAIRAARPEQELHYTETRAELVELLTTILRPGDLCLTMNAGDLTTLPDEMLAHPWARGT